MTKVLLDACVPHWLRRDLPGFEVETAHYAGLDLLPDRELLAAVEGHYDVLVTLDRSLTHQQKIDGRSFGIVVLSVAEQTPETFRALIAKLALAISETQPGEIRTIGR